MALPRRRLRRLHNLLDDLQASASLQWRDLPNPARDAIRDAIDGLQVDRDNTPLLVLRLLLRLNLINRQGRLTKNGQLVRQVNVEVPYDAPPE